MACSKRGIELHSDLVPFQIGDAVNESLVLAFDIQYIAKGCTRETRGRIGGFRAGEERKDERSPKGMRFA
jgi:hypothetical protein